MKNLVMKHTKDVIALGIVVLIAAIVGGYILSNQRFYLPNWVPVIGSDFVDYYADFSTAQAVTPGQGQTVIVAGVTVGEIGQVSLQDGKAKVQMKIRRQYADIHEDAFALLRPKTGLNDMTIQLNRGTPGSPEIPEGGTVRVSRTLPNVNPDEFLAGLDTDTRNYLQLLLNGGGQGLAGNSQELSATLKRFNPTAQYLARVGRLMGKREAYIRRSITNLSILTQTLGERDTELARFVRSSNDVFADLSAEQASVREAVRLLPGALQATDRAVVANDRLQSQLGPALGKLLPAANGTKAALVSLQDFAEATTPVLRDQLRPFTQEAGPTVATLKPASADLAASAPKLTTSFKTLNNLTNAIAYNPPGDEEGYGFWLGWAGHLNSAIFSMQDAMGPIRRGLLFSSCDALAIYEGIGLGNPFIGTQLDMLNAPTTAEVCGTAPAAVASGRKIARQTLKRQEEFRQSAQPGPVQPEPGPVDESPESGEPVAGASGGAR
jgi:phospholipid/cholesterol/gamma-HCH transport system substrate-binding protein